MPGSSNSGREATPRRWQFSIWQIFALTTICTTVVALPTVWLIYSLEFSVVLISLFVLAVPLGILGATFGLLGSKIVMWLFPLDKKSE